MHDIYYIKIPKVIECLPARKIDIGDIIVWKNLELYVIKEAERGKMLALALGRNFPPYKSQPV